MDRFTEAWNAGLTQANRQLKARNPRYTPGELEDVLCALRQLPPPA